MVNPTDRVIAKTIARVLQQFSMRIGMGPLEAALLLSDITAKIVGENKELEKGIISLLREVGEDLRAEAQGTASSIVGNNTPQPWEEDAGSGWVDVEGGTEFETDVSRFR